MSYPEEYGGLAPRRVIWIEVAVLFAVIEVPVLLGFLLHGFYWPLSTMPGVSIAGDIDATVSTAAFVALLLFVMWNSGDDWSTFALGRPNLLKTLAIAIPLVGIVFWFDWLGTVSTEDRDLASSWDYFAPKGAAVIPFVIYTVVAAVYEEIAWRGYFMSRFSEMFRSRAVGLLLSSITFALGHLYQGIIGAIGSLVFGLVIGFVVLKTRNLYIGMIVHTATNLLLYFVLW